MPIELLSVLKEQIRMRLSHHHFLLLPHRTKKVCIPPNILLHLQAHTRCGCLMIECLWMLGYLTTFLNISLLLMHAFLNLLAFFIQPLLHSIFALLLDILVYYVALFLFGYLLWKLFSITSIIQWGCLIFLDSFGIILFADLTILMFRFVHWVWEFS